MKPILLWLLLLAAPAIGAGAQSSTILREHAMLEHPITEAHGTFTVHMQPTSAEVATGIQGFSLDKVYSGDLQGSGTGEMLSAGNPNTGNAGYVAIERVTGTLAGHTGGFALMQLATMSTGTPPSLTMQIAPGSGTGQLAGITGSMTLAVTGGEHRYTLSYTMQP